MKDSLSFINYCIHSYRYYRFYKLLKLLLSYSYDEFYFFINSKKYYKWLDITIVIVEGDDAICILESRRHYCVYGSATEKGAGN